MPKAKENEVEDLKTCKSLLNVKVKRPKKVLQYFPSKASENHRYLGMHSLYEMADEPHTHPLKSVESEEFDLQPWSGNEWDRQKLCFRA